MKISKNESNLPIINNENSQPSSDGYSTTVSDDQIMNMLEIERNIYHSVIKQLTFTPCISQELFVDWFLEQDVGIDEYDKLREKLFDVNKFGYGMSYRQEYDRAKKKCRRLLSYLMSPNDTSKDFTMMFKSPKIYDAAIKNHKIELYNSMVKKLNHATRTGVKFPLIEIVIPKSSIEKMLSKEEIYENIEIIQNLYPYLYFGEREGLNFVECIILINILTTHRSKNLYKLTSIISHDISKKDAQLWVDQVVNNMRAKKIRRMYVDIFFYYLYNYTSEIYNNNAGEYIKKAWLPPRYFYRKDIFNAAQKHGEWQGDLIFSTGTLSEQIALEKNRELDFELNFLLLTVIPSAYDAMIENHKTKKELDQDALFAESNIYLYNYELAEACKEIAEKYIDESISTAQKVMYETFVQ